MSLATTDPRTEERDARKRQRRAEKARKARLRKLDEARWERVTERKRESGCKCALRPGMTHADLIELGPGCTANRHYICPVLDFYRRLIGGAK